MPIDPALESKYKDNYEKVENWKKTSKKMQMLMRNSLLPKFSGGIIGIFGHYKHEFMDKTRVEDAIEYVATKIARKNPKSIVITGKAVHFYNEANAKVESTDTINRVLLDAANNGELAWDNYNEILASVSTLALFFLNFAGRSSSVLEEHHFVENHYKENVLGVGVWIQENGFTQCDCFQIESTKLSDKTPYYVCTQIVSMKGPCAGSFHFIGDTNLSMFLARSFMKIVIASSWTDVPEIFEAIKQKILKS